MAEAIKILTPPTPEHHRIAAEQFHRANQVIEKDDYDYAIQLLLTCCKLEPANLTFRQVLRKTQKTKYQNNLRGSRFAALTTAGSRARMKSAKRAGDYLRVLEYGEQVLSRNPWHTKVQLRMAEAADMLNLLDLAIWILLQAREKDPNDLVVNRALARLCEKRGNFMEAVKLWELVRHVNPKDQEAQSKVKDLAAHHTITQGGYEQAVAGEAISRSGEHRLVKKAEGGEPAAADRIAQAAEPLRVRIEADPTNVNNYLDLAGLYRRAGRLDEARKILHEGLGPTANDFEMIMELSDLEIEPFRQNLAVTEEKLRANPQNEKLLRSRASLIKEINTRELDWFRKKADRFPTEKSYRFEMGIRLFRTGQLDEAIRELQGVRNDPRHQWRALMYLGHCFKTRQNWRLAQRNFEEALENLPPTEQATRKELLFQLASGAAEAGDLSRALELGYELANLDFAFRDIGRLVDEWQARLHKVGVRGGKD
jgi:tetratricopeptide (TPR) repeat protein